MFTAVDAPAMAQHAPGCRPWHDRALLPGATGVPYRTMPDFNDPAIRSLPICTLAIALAIMERTAMESAPA
jgi:hypothetical protein